MVHKLSDSTEKNSDSPEVKSALNSFKNQMKIFWDHSCILPFNSEPSDFQKVLSSWQPNKDPSEDKDG
tara:strand:+ start:335 stop:538 length:204 start_codon:yes stop_codon:yes gene_type:complete